MTASNAFKYPPLTGSDGIRLLQLEAGDFEDVLRGSLVSVPFSDRPSYVALSYTWQDRDKEHGDVGMPPRWYDRNDDGWGEPYLMLDGVRFEIGHNLALALIYLRPGKQQGKLQQGPMSLWIDQICINQKDMDERSAQVALMAFIFTRARLVVGWLGVDEAGLANGCDLSTLEKTYIRVRDDPRRRTLLHTDASRSSASSSAATGASSAATIPELFTTPEEVARNLIPTNTYWRRLWIVQEVCLPPRIAFLAGPHLWPEDRVRTALQFLPRMPDHQRAIWKSVENLLNARSGRFSAAMRLEALIERFADFGCGELRDRVYALIGLSNDAMAVPKAEDAGSDGDGRTMNTDQDSDDELEILSRLPDNQPAPPPPARGHGTILIDYQRPFFDIWQDTVLFMLHRAVPEQDFGKKPHELEDERRSKVVRFAGLLQRAFEGRVEAEVEGPDAYASKLPDNLLLRPRRAVLAKGYIAGKIIHLGPTYDECVGSYKKDLEWRSSWIAHYTDQSELEILRRMEEAYTDKIINRYSAEDLARVRGGYGGNVAFSPLRPKGAAKAAADVSRPLQNGLMPPPAPDSPPPPRDTNTTHQQVPPPPPPRRFLGTKLCMGLAPAEATTGDVIVRFWNCDAAIVARAVPWTTKTRVLVKHGDGKSAWEVQDCPPVYQIIGRADVAEVATSPSSSSKMKGDYRARDAITKVSGAVFENDRWAHLSSVSKNSGKTDALYVSVDFETLQKMTASIVAGD